MRKGRHKTTYKPNRELSRFALICDKLNLANVLSGNAVCQTTHCGRKQSELSKMRSVANVKQPICNAFISYFVMPFTFTYVLSTITGHTVYIYVNR